MDERIYTYEAATESTAIANARGRAEREGFETLRVVAKDITPGGRSWERVMRKWRVYLYGNEPDRWCPLARHLKSDQECVNSCPAPEQRAVCGME